MDIGEGTVDDPELLMGIMEAREAVELTQSEEELQQFAATFQQQAEACIEVVFWKPIQSPILLFCG